MSEEKIRIMLVDDHAVVRSGLSAFLSVHPDLELVGEAENGEQAVVRAGLLKPDVILMDLMMPVMDGVAATRGDQKAAPGHPNPRPDQLSGRRAGAKCAQSRGGGLPDEKYHRPRAGGGHPIRQIRQNDSGARSRAGARPHQPAGAGN